MVVSMPTSTWSDLPEHIVVRILQSLDWLQDVYRACLVCRNWHLAFHHPTLWRRLHIEVTDGEGARKQLICIDRFGPHVQRFQLNLDQFILENRQIALEALDKFAKLERGQLRQLIVAFCGENPLFYAGTEFVHAILEVLRNTEVAQIAVLDVHALHVKFTDDFLYLLAHKHSSTLTYLDLQNQQLICLITPHCLLHAIKACTRLIDLRVYYASCSDDCLLAVSDVGSGRQTLDHLSLLCSSQDKYRGDIERFDQVDLSDEAWAQFQKNVPEVRVTLKITHRCPPKRIREILRPSIPLWTLLLEAYTIAHAEIRIAAQHYVASLQHLKIITPMSANMELALVELVQSCSKLNTLHVLQPVSLPTIDTILATNPECEFTIIR